MSERSSGDADVKKLEGRFQNINRSNIPFNEKLILFDNAFRNAIGPWNIEGDDRVLSMMRIAALSAVDTAVQNEISRVGKSGETSSRSVAYDEIERLINTLPWLTAAAKSSISCSLSFAKYDTTLDNTEL